MDKFEIGDPVKRKIDPYDKNSGYRFGTVKDRYSQPAKDVCGSVLGPYPELYVVHFDNGEIRHGYMPHGLEHLQERPVNQLINEKNQVIGENFLD